MITPRHPQSDDAQAPRLRMGVLCSGGDSPGVNAALRGLVLRGVEVHGGELLGFMDGWRGVLEGDATVLERANVQGISPLGGVLIGTSRVPPFARAGADGTHPPDEALDPLRAKMREYDLDGFYLIGGNGTQTVARILTEHGIPVIGLPKTIDNDLGGTDATFGFDTAVSIAAEAIDRLRTTGDAHRRCMLLEVMGREAGWIALHAGVAGGAHAILIPEVPESIEQICTWVTGVHERGRSSLIVVAEGFRLAGGTQSAKLGVDELGRPRFGGVAGDLMTIVEECTGIETRATVLGHVQRGGAPTAFDRVLATRSAYAAADAAVRGEWGTLAALRGDRIDMVPLTEIAETTRTVPADRYAELRLNFG